MLQPVTVPTLVAGDHKFPGRVFRHNFPYAAFPCIHIGVCYVAHALRFHALHQTTAKQDAFILHPYHDIVSRMTLARKKCMYEVFSD